MAIVVDLSASGHDAGFAVPAGSMRTTPGKAVLTLEVAESWLCMGAAMHTGWGSAGFDPQRFQQCDSGSAVAVSC